MNILGFLIYCALVIPPLWLLMPRWGISPYVALVGLLPIGVVGLLWYMALKPSAGAGGTMS